MKNTYNYLAVLAVLASSLASCTREPVSYDGTDGLAPNTVAFFIEDAPNTRSGDILSVNNIKLGKGLDGQDLYFQDIVTRSGIDIESLPVTKGTPVTDENIASIHGNRGLYVHRYSPDGTHIDVQTFGYSESLQRWSYEYPSNPFPADGSDITFLIETPEYNLSRTSDGNVTFDYTASHYTGILNMNDLLIGGVKLNHSTYTPSGFSVTLYHPLVGVRFKLGDNTSGIIINEITMSGIYSTGVCVMNPFTGVTTWTPDTQSIDNELSFNPPAPQNDGSLDDGTGQYTFWLIPQALRDDATLTVKLTKYGVEQTFTVNLKDALAEPEFKAGDLHTFVLTPNFIEVLIERLTSEQSLEENRKNC